MLSSKTILPWQLSPLEAVQRWPSALPLALLHSGRFDTRWSRYSILARPTCAYRFCMTGENSGKSEMVFDNSAIKNSPAYQPPSLTHHPLEDLEKVLAQDTALWIGYIGYDIARFIETLPAQAKADRNWPLIQLQRCPGWLVHDGLNKTWSAGGNWPDKTMPDLSALPKQNLSFKATAPLPCRSRDEHEKAVARAIDYIGAGDIFQVNLAQRFTSKFSGNRRGLFTALAEISPAWYGGHIELISKTKEASCALISTSPELFLQFDNTGNIITRPIKGTLPAGKPAQQLIDSAKDAAELNMIIDLLRNDLGRICKFNSVKVTQPRTIETHPTIHHGVATIEGKLGENIGLADIIRATMPGGSITGAPKIRAMEIIDQLEPVQRGPYCGAMGYFHNGSGCLNILIRTMLCENSNVNYNAKDGRLKPALQEDDQTSEFTGRVDFSVGGGIVADSTPGGEYQETLDKAAAMTAALNS